jgi:tRNA A22 N-methylase
MPFCYYPRSCVSKMVSIIRSRATREEVDRVIIQGQERKETLRERFIKNKKPLNVAHLFPKKEKQLKTRITKRTILMS